MMERDGHKTTSAMSICGPMKAIRRHLCEDRRDTGEEGLVFKREEKRGSGKGNHA